MRTQHAPPEEARRAGNVRPEAPLCSPSTRGTRLPRASTTRLSTRDLTHTCARRPLLNETGVTSPILSTHHPNRARIQHNAMCNAPRCSGKPAPEAPRRSPATRGSAGQGTSTARRSTHDHNPSLARRPPLEETGVTPPQLSALPSLTRPHLEPRASQRSKAFRQTSARSSPVQSGALDALGRRGREADPDSRSEAKRGVSAKREKHRVRGRRHLAVNS